MLQEEEFKSLFEKHYSSLYQVGLNILRNGDAAHDAVQDVFTILWKKREQLMFTGPLEVYLKKAVINTSLNHLKRYSRQISFEAEHELPYEERGNIDDEAFKKALEKGIATLTPKCKTVFVLSRMEGLDNQEIADFLSVSKKTVENQLSIALKKLKEYFEDNRNDRPDLFRMFMMVYF